MLVLVCVVHQWICFCFTFSLKARGEACKDKFDAGKLRAVLVSRESDSGQC